MSIHRLGKGLHLNAVETSHLLRSPLVSRHQLFENIKGTNSNKYILMFFWMLQTILSIVFFLSQICLFWRHICIVTSLMWPSRRRKFSFCHRCAYLCHTHCVSSQVWLSWSLSGTFWDKCFLSWRHIHFFPSQMWQSRRHYDLFCHRYACLDFMSVVFHHIYGLSMPYRLVMFQICVL